MAINLTGNNSTIRYGSIPVLNNMSPISISAWIRPFSQGSGTTFARIVAKESTGGYLLYLGGTNAFQFAVLYTGTTPSNLNVISNNNILTINANPPWQHVAATWNGNREVSSVNLYYNGNLISNNIASTAGNTTRVDDSAATLEIGNRSTGSRGFVGDIAEVGVWNKVLTSQEINSLAQRFSCKYIGSDRRIFSAPLIRSFSSPERDVSITTIGATVATHPSIFI